MIRALIFDYNQVLVNDSEAHVEAYERALKKFGVKMEKEELRKIMPLGHGGKAKYIAEKFGLFGKEEEIFSEKRKEFEKIAKEKDLMFPGAREAIKKLSERFLLGIFTSTPKSQVFLPKKTMKLFKALVSHEGITKPKPDPEGIIKCAKLLRVTLEKSAYVGDATQDMQAAKAAGCKAIGITTGIFNAEQLKKAGADIIIAEIKELQKEKL